MRRTSAARPWTTVATVAAALASLAGPAARAQTVKETLDITREAVESQRRVLVSGALPLSDAEASAFWPLYDDYEKARRPLDTGANQLVADLVASAATMTDAQASAMLEQALKLDERRLERRRHYLERMAKALPPRKLARFFQIDNKLDAVVRADISRQVPLVP